MSAWPTASGFSTQQNGPDLEGQAFQSQQLGKQLSGQNTIAATSAAPAMLAAQNQQSRFNTVFPWLQGQVGQFSSSINGGAGGTAGFGVGGPTINTGGVYNPQQIQSQVNAANATTDRATSTQNQQAQQQMGGRGFGSNSPMLMALQGQNFASGLGAKTAAEQNLRTQAAQANATQQLAGQSAEANAYAQRKQEALQARGQSLGAWSSVMSALSGLGS